MSARLTHALALCALAGVVWPVPPAEAFERMDAAQCQQSFTELALLFNAGDRSDPVLDQRVTVTGEGWCYIAPDPPSLPDANVSSIEWRAEGLARFIDDGIPPLALELRVRGLKPDALQGDISTDRPDLTFSAVLRQDPQAGQVIVERAELSNGAGDVLAFSGVFGRVFLTSPSMMQVSIGAAALNAGLVQMTLSGAHENPFGLPVDVEFRGNPQAQSRAAFEVLSLLPDGLLATGARETLSEFAGALPKPVGALEVGLYSERGLGFVQVGVALSMSANRAMDKRELDILFDGLSLNATWTPATGPAE